MSRTANRATGQIASGKLPGRGFRHEFVAEGQA